MIFFNRLQTSKNVTSRVSQTPPFTRLEGAFQKSQGVECRRFLSLPSHFAASPIVFFFRPRFTFRGTESVTSRIRKKKHTPRLAFVG